MTSLCLFQVINPSNSLSRTYFDSFDGLIPSAVIKTWESKLETFSEEARLLERAVEGYLNPANFLVHTGEVSYSLGCKFDFTKLISSCLKKINAVQNVVRRSYDTLKQLSEISGNIFDFYKTKNIHLQQISFNKKDLNGIPRDDRPTSRGEILSPRRPILPTTANMATQTIDQLSMSAANVATRSTQTHTTPVRSVDVGTQTPHLTTLSSASVYPRHVGALDAPSHLRSNLFEQIQEMMKTARYEAFEKSRNTCHGRMFFVNESTLERVREMNKIHPEVVKLTKGSPRYSSQFFYQYLYSRPILGPFRSRESGSTFFGQFNHGRLEGLYLEVSKSGEVFIGRRKYGHPHGVGLRCTPTNVYFGQFRDGFAHGKGVQTLANGDHYDGDFLRGIRQGQGTLKWKKGVFILGVGSVG